MLGRIKQTDLSVPYRIGEYFYYSRTEEGKQYPYMCRRKGSMEGAEEILLDLNALAEGHKYLGARRLRGERRRQLAGVFGRHAPDTGSTALHVKDLRSGRMLAENDRARRVGASGRPTTRRSSTRRKTRCRSARTGSGVTRSARRAATCSTRRRTSSSTSARADRSTRRLIFVAQLRQDVARGAATSRRTARRRR